MEKQNKFFAMFIFAILFLNFVVFVNAESNSMVSQQRQALAEYCKNANYDCTQPNTAQPDTQDYNMREYCCSQNISGNSLTNTEESNNVQNIIIAVGVILLLVLIGYIIYLKRKRK